MFSFQGYLSDRVGFKPILIGLLVFISAISATFVYAPKYGQVARFKVRKYVHFNSININERTDRRTDVQTDNQIVEVASRLKSGTSYLTEAVRYHSFQVRRHAEATGLEKVSEFGEYVPAGQACRADLSGMTVIEAGCGEKAKGGKKMKPFQYDLGKLSYINIIKKVKDIDYKECWSAKMKTQRGTQMDNRRMGSQTDSSRRIPNGWQKDIRRANLLNDRLFEEN